MSALLRLDEVAAMVKVKIQFRNQRVSLRDDQADLKFCYDILQHVSRSFAAVIIQLHDELRDAVCLFYLVLRGLDTVEDDMSVPLEKKLAVLPHFHEKLEIDDWHIDGIGEGKERELLEKFWCVCKGVQQLKKEYREVISDICEKMANGMCHFLQNEVVTRKDYDLYCHYVAGLVGHGLTRLFACSGLEDPAIAKDLTIANSMGLFLQKVNITRDYFEDILQQPPRMFWPKEVWGMYANNLADLKEPQNKRQAIECLNTLVCDALQHVPDCLDYMAQLKEPSVFLFCAIPQVMAIATLAELINNHKVFTEKVKIRKGAACKIIINSTSMSSLLQQFAHYASVIESNLKEEDPSHDGCVKALQAAKARNDQYATKLGMSSSYARSFFLQYPALGGRLLYNVVDSVGGLFRQQQAV